MGWGSRIVVNIVSNLRKMMRLRARDCHPSGRGHSSYPQPKEATLVLA